MRYMSSLEIRNTWLKFFTSKGHTVEPSASLVPIQDPTLLWINAGVAPLKKYFDGRETPKSRRITNVQKCIRTNDIENVGHTARHHTFFEMMGNFSIGDYFKKEAISFAYELLTGKDYFAFPKDKLYITVYTNDKETFDTWVSLGIDPSHLIKMDSNFWEIGEGPSGPDTEIFFDRGEKYDKRGKELIELDLENDRFIEIWNVVFSQYNAEPGKKKREEYNELPSKNIDTGAGLERFACVLQGVDTNYDTDLFMPIIKKIEEISNVKYQGQMGFKVIADHVRTVTFALADGATFSNEGRGYVLRRVLRRAMKYAKKLGINHPFMTELVDVVLAVMGEFYPYLKDNVALVKKLINIEENKFMETLANGEAKLKELANNSKEILSGSDAFLLYDTYGFPIELTEEYALEYGLKVDIEAFKDEMNKQKERARKARKDLNSMNAQNEEFLKFDLKSEFIGYDTLETKAKVIASFDNGIVLDKTPFYATSGGQVCDKGTIDNVNVIDVFKLPNGQFLHVLEENIFKVGDVVSAKVDENLRHLTMANHSSAHLLQKALQDVLGNHVHQQGSQVGPDYCRFDFNNYEALTDDEIIKVEDIVNQKIEEGLTVNTLLLPIEEAKKMGAMALFGEKYGDIVRVVDMGYSKEFCGGTHVKNTKEIKHLSIASIESIGSGIFRALAYTGSDDFNLLKESLANITSDLDKTKEKISIALKEFDKANLKPKATLVKDFNLDVRGYRYIIEYRKCVYQYKEYLKALNKELNELNAKNSLADLAQFDKYIKNNTLICRLDGFDNALLKQLADALLNKLGSGLIFLANVKDEKITFVCKQNANFNAGLLVKEAASLTSGNGGGKADIAQGGGKDIDKLDLALAKIKELVNA